MRRPAAIPSVVLAVLAACALPGCGDPKGGGPVPPTQGPVAGATPGAAAAPDAAPEATVKARLEALFAAVRAGGEKGAGAALAPFVVYRGGDATRRYKSSARYEGDEIRQVDRVGERIRKHLAAGAPAFEKAETRSKGGEAWVAWTITFGTGEGASKALYACVKAGDAWLLGDIDD
ncbi:MAG: hypothetical protein JNM10_14235 [Planctomycetia bacterium]|nr:hypothetical protein [Planctomycetia bacterium]